MFFLAGIFSALMLSGLVVMIDSDEDGQFDDTENLEDNGFEARKMHEGRFVTGSDADRQHTIWQRRRQSPHRHSRSGSDQRLCGP